MGLGEKSRGLVWWKMCERLTREEMVVAGKSFECQHKKEVNVSKDRPSRAAGLATAGRLVREVGAWNRQGGCAKEA